MTWVLGAFGGETNFERNKYLNDGGACLLKDGKVHVAISEERITRKKHAPGFKNAIKYCLESAGISIDDVDLFVFSNCCDQPLPLHFDYGLNISNAKRRVYNITSHHLSHTYLAYALSGYEEALIIVMDNEGNILNLTAPVYYWKNSLERNSYYIAKNGSIELIERDCVAPNEIGVGDTYHYFCHFLGFPSYQLAGHVMALAAFGNLNGLGAADVFEMNDSGKLKSNIANNRFEKEGEICKFLSKYNVNLHPRKANEKISTRHMDVAFFIQSELEEILIKKVNFLCQRTGIKNLCLSGGVAYNCAANRRILNNTPIKSIFIPMAPGDEGQCIGNALWGYTQVLGLPLEKNFLSPFSGRIYSEKIIKETLTKYKNQIKFRKEDNISEKVAELLSQGYVIGWFQGGSEIGRRALGNRSILADPRNAKMKDRINAIKGREFFRPVSPSVLYDYQANFFDTDKLIPYMNIVAKAKDPCKVPSVVHVDGTSRIQSVRKQDNVSFYMLIEAFREITGIPLLINTSFNKGGEPIVETPEEAINNFLAMDIDFLVISNYLIEKRIR